MTITLTTDQQAWIDAHIASGEFATVEDAAHTLIDAAILDRAFTEHTDLTWVKPLVDEALDASQRGGVMSLEEHRSRNRARLAAMRDE